MKAAVPGLVLSAGARIKRLPPQLETCKFAVVWAWDGLVNEVLVRMCLVDAPPQCRHNTSQLAPVQVERQHLLYHLNECLSTTALLVQPWPGNAKTSESSAFVTAAVPLPLDNTCIRSASWHTRAFLEDREGGKVELEVELPFTWMKALQNLGLAGALGYFRLVKVCRCTHDGYMNFVVPVCW